MSKMRTLIIPDTHNRWELFEKIVKHESPDLTISLGDVFDDFNDDPHIIADVADWFHHSINKKDRIHICGNHDLHYWFKENPSVRCSGYSQPKSIVINNFVTSDDWKKLVFYYNLDGKWLLSHAGVHPCWIDGDKFHKCEKINTDIIKLSKKLKRETEQFLIKTSRGEFHWFGVPGFSRCDNSPYYGGVLWCDWDKEFWPTRGVHQITGHTPLHQLKWIFLTDGDPVTHTSGLGVVPKLRKDTSYNICIDSHPGSQYYAIYEGGLLTIHKTLSIK